MPGDRANGVGGGATSPELGSLHMEGRVRPGEWGREKKKTTGENQESDLVSRRKIKRGPGQRREDGEERKKQEGRKKEDEKNKCLNKQRTFHKHFSGRKKKRISPD